jgi:hypothetical protein
MQSRKHDPRREAERTRLRGMPENQFEVAAFAAMSHLRPCRLLRDSPNRHATEHFHATGHPIIEGYDPPEGSGLCYVDEVFLDLSDRITPQLGPIPRNY